MRFISSQANDRSYTFQEAALSEAGYLIGVFVPEAFSSLSDHFWDRLHSLSFCEQMAECFFFLLGEGELSWWNRIMAEAYAEDQYGEQPLFAQALNAYKADELIMLTDRGPSGSRYDYANSLAHVLYREWRGEEPGVCPYAGPGLDQVFSLAEVPADTDSAHAAPPLYLLDPEMQSAERSPLLAYLAAAGGQGVFLEESAPQAELILQKWRSTLALQDTMPERAAVFLPANGNSVISLLTQMSLLLISLARFRQAELIGDDKLPDLALCVDDLDMVLAAIYIKSMGAPLGQIIVAENHNRVFCELLRSGRFQMDAGYRQSRVSFMNTYLPAGFEALLFELLGRNRELLQACWQSLCEQGRFSVDRSYCAAWSQHLQAIYNHDKAVVRSCRSLYDRSDFLLDGGAAAAFAAGQMARRDYTTNPLLVLSSHNPLWSLEISYDALFGNSTHQKSLPTSDRWEAVEAVAEEAGIVIPPAFLHLFEQSTSHPELPDQSHFIRQDAALDVTLSRLIELDTEDLIETSSAPEIAGEITKETGSDSGNLEV